MISRTLSNAGGANSEAAKEAVASQIINIVGVPVGTFTAGVDTNRNPQIDLGAETTISNLTVPVGIDPATIFANNGDLSNVRAINGQSTDRRNGTIKVSIIAPLSDGGSRAVKQGISVWVKKVIT
jgi:hypothetical protein